MLNRIICVSVMLQILANFIQGIGTPIRQEMFLLISSTGGTAALIWDILLLSHNDAMPSFPLHIIVLFFFFELTHTYFIIILMNSNWTLQ